MFWYYKRKESLIITSLGSCTWICINVYLFENFSYKVYRYSHIYYIGDTAVVYNSMIGIVIDYSWVIKLNLGLYVPFWHFIQFYLSL